MNSTDRLALLVMLTAIMTVQFITLMVVAR